MKYLSRLLLTIAVGAIVCVGVSRVFASSAVTGEPSLTHRLIFELRRSEALRQRTREAFRSLEIKKAIVEDLIADRLTFREAVEQFAAAIELIAEDADGLLPPYHAPRTEEELRQNIIVWVRNVLEDDPAEGERVVRRLLEQESAQTSAAADVAP